MCVDFSCQTLKEGCLENVDSFTYVINCCEVCAKNSFGYLAAELLCNPSLLTLALAVEKRFVLKHPLKSRQLRLRQKETKHIPARSTGVISAPPQPGTEVTGRPFAPLRALRGTVASGAFNQLVVYSSFQITDR